MYGVPMYFDRDGQPITFERWAELMCSDEYRRVAWDEPRVGVYVSTVWLGLNHGCDPDEPLIFETMVFNSPFSDDCCRYTSQVEAVCGHLEVVERVSAGREPWGD